MSHMNTQGFTPPNDPLNIATFRESRATPCMKSLKKLSEPTLTELRTILSRDLHFNQIEFLSSVMQEAIEQKDIIPMESTQERIRPQGFGMNGTMISSIHQPQSQSLILQQSNVPDYPMTLENENPCQIEQRSLQNIQEESIMSSQVFTPQFDRMDPKDMPQNHIVGRPQISQNKFETMQIQNDVPMLTPQINQPEEEMKLSEVYTPAAKWEDAPTYTYKINSVPQPMIGNQYEPESESSFANEAKKFETQRDLEETMVIISPHQFQKNVVARIKEHWRVQDKDKHYGSIVYIDTGAGKTYIALMMIKEVFGEGEEIKMLTEKQIQAKKDIRRDAPPKLGNSKKVVFLVPTNNLVDQQGSVIDQFTNRIVGKFHGGQKHRKFYKEHETWHNEFVNHDVFIFNGKKFYDLLLHGYLTIDQIDLLIFDECHHTDQDHLYNLVMRDFFYHKYSIENCKRPKILGLTASPIKSKIEYTTFSMKNEIQEMLQNLCNNLYSQFIPISEQDLQEIKKDIQVDIDTYNEEFQENIDLVKTIEVDLIQRLIDLMSHGQGYKTKEVMNFIQSCIFDEFQLEQDNQILKFLTGRKKLIEFDSHFAKSNIDLVHFQDHEKRLLVLLSIIILKNANNLLIELGMAGVKAFLQSLNDDFVGRSNKFKKYKEHLLEILGSFINKISSYNEVVKNSKKVEKLVDILKRQKDSVRKTIIFVKDRSVAFYLKNILKYELGANQPTNQSFTQSNNNSTLDQSINQSINTSMQTKTPVSSSYNIGVAMGQKGRSLLSKAYKSTNTGGFDIERDLSYLSSAFGSVQMSNAELMKNLQDFKVGKINILIATNVVEEGLDVSSCNQVICLNELFTVKAFIQMKGRARQNNSQFIFICSKEQEQEVTNDYDTFKNVIDNMQQIAYKKYEGIVPDENIIAAKQLKDNEVFEVRETGAKVVSREAKILLELFVTAAAEEYHKTGSDNQYKNQGSQNAEDMKKNHPYKVFFDTQERSKNNVKYFFSVLYMPRSCKQYLEKVNPLTAFAKKKDAENHVALLAIQKLYEKGLFSKHLYPKIGLKEAAGANGSGAKQSSFVTALEESQLKNELKDFHAKQKKDKSKECLYVDQKHRSLISESLELHHYPHLYVYVIKGINENNTYPYKGTTDFLGFVFNRTFNGGKIEFQIQQENRQKQKNIDHIQNLINHQPDQFINLQNRYQSQHKLDYEISANYVQELTSSQRQDINYVQRLRFFHTFIFYTMYNGDHKFYKGLLKGKYSFADVLFGKVLNLLRTKQNFKMIIQQVYGVKATNTIKSFWSSIESLKFYQYLVPIKRIGAGKYVINETLIDNCIGYVNAQLLRLVSQFEQNKTMSIYDVEDQATKDVDQAIDRVWTCESNKLRHVIISAIPVNKSTWKEKSIVFTSKKLAKDAMVIDEGKQKQIQDFKQLVLGNTFTNISGHYFYKCGILLDRNQNVFLTKSRKERHFLDFTIQRESIFDVEEQEEGAKGGCSSTLFDVPSQLYTLFPLSYDQYQVAQQACSFQSKFNEFLMVENFINYLFKDLKCFNDLPIKEQYIGKGFQKPLKRKNDVFLSTMGAETFVTDKLIRENQIVTEALTSPTAHRDYDYERLEFLGDSIISFLVILELYLTKEQLYREGDLDFHRIKTVSNMNFLKVNKKFSLYQFMIIEPSKIFSEFTPGGIDQSQYQNKLKHKHLNELNNKIKYLKLLENHLVRNQDTLGHDELGSNQFYSIICKIMKKKELRDKYLSDFINQLKFQSVKPYNGLYNREGFMKITDALILNNQQCIEQNSIDLQLTGEKLQLCIVRDLINKTEAQKRQAKMDKKLKSNCTAQKQSKVFFYKQLADIVESVAGAVFLTCGFNSTQDYLRTLEILKFDQNKYRLEMDILDQKQKRLETPLITNFYLERNLEQLEHILGYTFKCKTWIIEALTHKSFNETLIDSNIDHPQDYERLEFLGDSILNSQVAYYFFKHTMNDEQKKNPKELHKMKTSIVNNVLLSLALIENNMHDFVIFNEKAFQFKYQFQTYVYFVQEQLKMHGTTAEQKENKINGKLNPNASVFSVSNIKVVDQSMNLNESMISKVEDMFEFSALNQVIDGNQQNLQALDLDLLYEKSLKIFGDVFEALIGAVFLDSKSITITKQVLFHLLNPYIKVYANLENMQDHGRTKLLELWNSRPFSKNIKCFHKNEVINGGQYIVLKGFISTFEMLTIKFDKDAKNKIRTFYKKFFKVIEGFLTEYETFFERYQYADEQTVIQKAREFSKSQQFQEILNSVDTVGLTEVM